MYPVDVSQVVDVLGGAQLIHMAGNGLSDLQQAIAHGLPVIVARNVAASVAPTDGAVRQRVTDMIASPATLKRRKTLSAEAGERAERLARISALAVDALGDRAEAQEWLTEKHILFGQPPIDLAATELGARRVERILINIKYSLPL